MTSLHPYPEAPRPPRRSRSMPPDPPMPPRPPVLAEDEPPSGPGPVYQWRYRAGNRGYVHPWMDVAVDSGVHIGYGVNRITDVEFRIKPEREICEAQLRSHDAKGFHDHRCVRTLGHPPGERHITTIEDHTVEWE